jgi:molecular chaperone DnaK
LCVGEHRESISVDVRRFKEHEIVVLTKSRAPMFGDRVHLRLPNGPSDPEIVGEVVALERIRGEPGGVLVSVSIEEPLVRALARLEEKSTSPQEGARLRESRSPGVAERPSASPSDEDDQHEQRGSRPNSELHWGWVATDRDSAPIRESQESDPSGATAQRSTHGGSRDSGVKAPLDIAAEKSKQVERSSQTPSSPKEEARRLIPGGIKPPAEQGRYSLGGSYSHSQPSRRKERGERPRKPSRNPPSDPRAEPDAPQAPREGRTRRSSEAGPAPNHEGRIAKDRRDRQAKERRRTVGPRPPTSRKRMVRTEPDKPLGSGGEKAKEKPVESAGWRVARPPAADWDAWDETSSFDQPTVRDSSIPEASGGLKNAQKEALSRSGASDASRREPDAAPMRGTESNRSEGPRPELRADASPVARQPSEAQSPDPEALRRSALDQKRSKGSEHVRQIEARASGVRRSGHVASRGESAPVVGIDFGTTFSKIALFDGDEVVLIEDTASKSATRAAVSSTLAMISDGTLLVGDPAREFLASDPTQVVSSVKRVLGLKFSDPLSNGLLGSLACRSLAGPNDSVLFEIQGKQITSVEVVSIILKHLVEMASGYTGAKVKRAVLTYPVDFDRIAKRELELAAKMAGLDVLDLISEPVAAVMGCGFDPRKESIVAVYDFGGGTFDATFVKVGNDNFDVLGSAGDRWLGGDDLDELLARFVADEYARTSGIRVHQRKAEYQRLLFACEEAKRWLSTLESVDVILPRAAITADGPKTLLVPVTREHFEDISEDVITSSLEVCRQAAEEAGISPQDADQLLLTGGTSRIPAVRKGVQRYFDRRGVAGIHPEHAVVIGAAVRAAVLGGIQVPGDFRDRLQSAGSAGRSVGLSLADGTTEPIIDATQPPPVAAHRMFSTSIDGQTACRIELVKGSSTKTEENHLLGGFVIDGLPPRPAGATNLDIYFELSSTGTLYVTAQDRASGQRAQGTFDLIDE